MVRGIHKLASSIVEHEINLVSDLRVQQLNTSGYCLQCKQRETIINGTIAIFLFFFSFHFISISFYLNGIVSINDVNLFLLLEILDILDNVCFINIIE